MIARRRTSVWRVPVLAATATLVSGCAASTFWGAGVPEGFDPSLSGTKSAVVVSVGEAGWLAASQQIGKVLAQAWPLGMPLEGAGSLDLGPGLAGVDATWLDAVVEFEAAEVIVSPLGLELVLELAVDRPFFVELSVGGVTACLVSVDLAEVTLSSHLQLARTKQGNIKAAPVGQPTLAADELTIQGENCPGPEDLGFDTDDPAAPLIAALTLAILEPIAPVLADAVPAALGVGLATGWVATFGDDGVGSGTMSGVLRVPPASSGKLWTYASDRMVTPFGVSIDATNHACVPAASLPAAASSPVPIVEAVASLLVHQDVMARAAAAVWSAGGLCLDRATRALELTAGDLAPAWGGLAQVDPDLPLSLRLWPEELPVLTLGGDAAGAAAGVDTGVMVIDVMGLLDGAWVRLATVRAALDIDADVVATPAGEVWLTPTDVQVIAASTAAGLLVAPEVELVEVLASTLTEALLGAAPLWWLPPLPGGMPEQVGWYDGFIAFSVP